MKTESTRKHIWLVRHAKTHGGSSFQQDYERTLTERGAADATALGHWLLKQRVVCDKVVCSTAVRTRETVARMQSVLPDPLSVVYDDALYLASSDDLLLQLHMQSDEVQSLVMVGHNPGLHHLCLMLAGNANPSLVHEVEMGFPTCAVARLESSAAAWSEVAAMNTQLSGFWVKPAV